MARESRHREVARGSRLVGDIVAVVYAQRLGSCARGALLDLGCGEAPLHGIYRTLVTNITCIDWAGSLPDVGRSTRPRPIESSQLVAHTSSRAQR